VRLLPPSTNIDPVNHFLASVNDLFEHVLQNVSDSDMVEMTIHNQVNQSDKPVGNSFRRRDQLSGDVLWSVFEKMTQSNSTFNALDTLVVNCILLNASCVWRYHDMDRPISVVAHLKNIS